jgi:DNA-binding winged helix-turn-helix (wHTH) protein
MLPVLRDWTETEVHLNRYLSQTVAWPDAALHELLRQRLMAFSEGRVESLRALFDDPGSVQDADARLVRWASGSPRALLELGDDLLDVPRRSPGPSPKLTEADLEAIEKRFQEQYAPKLIPPLRLEQESGRVLTGDQLVAEMSGMEFALLRFLYTYAGQVKSKEDIWEKVYEYTTEGVSDAAIDSLVHRVRKKIERDSSNPVYLKTVPRKGYQLLNTSYAQPEMDSP